MTVKSIYNCYVQNYVLLTYYYLGLLLIIGMTKSIQIIAFVQWVHKYNLVKRSLPTLWLQ